MDWSWASNAPTGISLLVSLGALWVSWRSLGASREATRIAKRAAEISQEAASNAIKPVLSIKLLGGSQKNPDCYEIAVRNHGTGPAVLRDCIFHEPHKTPRTTHLKTALQFALIHYKSEVLQIHQINTNDVIEPGETRKLLSLVVKEMAERDAERAYIDLSGLRFDIEYKDLAEKPYVSRYKND